MCQGNTEFPRRADRVNLERGSTMSQGDISLVEQLRNTGNNRWHYSAAGQQALLPPVETGSPFSQQAMQHDSDSNRPLKGSSRLWHDDVKQQGFSDKHRSSENSMHLSHNDFKQHESKDKHQASTDAKHGSRSNYVPLGDCGTWTSIEVQPMPADFYKPSYHQSFSAWYNGNGADQNNPKDSDASNDGLDAQVARKCKPKTLQALRPTMTRRSLGRWTES